MCLRFLFPFFLLISLIQAESVKSITGNIIFDINNDGTSEAKLTSDGLAIGDGLSPSANLHLQGNGIVTGDLVIGGTAGNSTLEVQGTVGYTHQTVSSNTTLSGNSVVLVDTSSDNVTVTLPYAGNVLGRLYTIKKTSTSNEVLLKGGGNNIDSGSSYTFTSGNNSSIKVVSNGNQWYVMSQSGIGFFVNGSWTPADITTALWLDASDTSTITTGATFTWDDKSGNANHVSQGTGSEQPTTGTRTIGGLNTLDFTSDSLDFTTSTNCLGKAVFAVVESDDIASDEQQILSTDSPNLQLRIQSSNGAIGYASGLPIYPTNPHSTDTLSVGNPAIIGYLLNTTMQFSVDGTFEDSGDSDDGDGLSIFNRIGARGSGDRLNGKLGELIITDSMPDTATRQKIEGYLANKWGLTANLPSDHPYKSTAP